MSRVGRQIITLPEKTDISVADSVVTVTGPNGSLTRTVKPVVAIQINDDRTVTLSPKGDSKAVRSLWGTYASHIANMVHGVNEAFVKRLVVEGVGYRVEQSGNTLTLSVGFSHPVAITIPDALTVTVEKNVITISGADKEVVGQFAAQVRATKKPEPYKGKGIRYEDEIVRRKEGKKSA